MKKVAIIFGITLSALFVISLVVMNIVKISPISWGMHNDYNASHHHALNSYDVVAFHTDKKAVKGTTDFVLSWKREKWHFFSKENLELFKANPEKYIPFVGGYCIKAVSTGFVAPIEDFSNFEIKDGKLIFFSNNKVREEVMKDLNSVIEKAKYNWN